MPGTKFSYGNKSAGIKGLRTKILAPALTSHYEVKIPRATAEQLSGNAKGSLNKILDPILGTDGQENLNISCSETNLPGSGRNLHPYPPPPHIPHPASPRCPSSPPIPTRTPPRPAPPHLVLQNDAGP